jgi:hypothetical protein
MKRPNLRDLAVLTAKRSDGEEVERLELSLLDYYKGLHELIDSAEYRAGKGVITLEGRLYDSQGRLVQDFVNQYGPSGQYQTGRAVHADGTVTENLAVSTSEPTPPWLLDEAVGLAVEDSMTLLDGTHSGRWPGQGDSCGARRPQKEDVLVLGDEVAGGELFGP